MTCSSFAGGVAILSRSSGATTRGIPFLQTAGTLQVHLAGSAMRCRASGASAIWLIGRRSRLACATVDLGTRNRWLIVALLACVSAPLSEPILTTIPCTTWKIYSPRTGKRPETQEARLSTLSPYKDHRPSFMYCDWPTRLSTRTNASTVQPIGSIGKSQVRRSYIKVK